MRIAQRWIRRILGKRIPIPASMPSVGLAKPIHTFLQSIPKAEIHLHFEGAIYAETIFHLARQYRTPEIRTLSDAQWRLYFSTPSQFFQNFLAVSGLLRQPEDFYRAALDLGERLAAQNIQYVELTFAPHKFMRAGVPYPAMMEAINRGLRESPGAEQREHRFIIDIVRDLGAELGMEMIREVEKHPLPEVVGIGLGGGENYPPEQSAEVFRYAESIGLRKTAHAGEGRGAESIWGALRSLGVERIDHGVRAREDRELVEYLIANRIPLNQCPTSNVMLGVVSSLEEHPFREYWERGVLLTVGSDDPAFFQTTLTEELEKLIAFQRFTPEEIPVLMENALRASFLPETEKTVWINRFRAETEPLLRDWRESEAHPTGRSSC